MEPEEKSLHPSRETPEGMVLRAVGTVRNRIKAPFLAAGEGGIELQGDRDAIRAEIRESYRQVSEIVIRQELAGILTGVEEYSHLIVLYWGHKVPEKSRLLTQVHPMGRKENPRVGIFATCSPARPNPVLMTVVRLHGRKENVLQVSGLDAVDESPVIDIKPYVKEFYPQQEIRVPEWMERICREMGGPVLKA